MRGRRCRLARPQSRLGPVAPAPRSDPLCVGAPGAAAAPSGRSGNCSAGEGGGGRGGQWPPLCGAEEGGTHTRRRALCDAPSPGRRRWRPPLFELRCCRAPVTQFGLESCCSAQFFITFFSFLHPLAPSPRWAGSMVICGYLTLGQGGRGRKSRICPRGSARPRPLPRSRSWRRSCPPLSLLPRSPPAPHVTGAGSRISRSRCAGNPARSAALRWRRGCATAAPGSAGEVLPPPRASAARKFIHRFLLIVESGLDLVESL